MIKQITKWVSSDGSEWSTEDQARHREQAIHASAIGARWVVERIKDGTAGVIVTLQDRKIGIAELVTELMAGMRAYVDKRPGDDQDSTAPLWLPRPRTLCCDNGATALLLTPNDVVNGTLKGKTFAWVWLDDGLCEQNIMREIEMTLRAPPAAMLVTYR